MNQRFIPQYPGLPLLFMALAVPMVLGLTACTSVPKNESAEVAGTTTQAAPAAARPYHENIFVEGRMSLRYQQNYTENAVYGSFAWTQTPEHTLVTLRSPLGQTVATIALTPTQATLTQSGQPPQTASDVDSLAANALGWPLPISGLRHWLQGYVQQDGRRVAADPQSRETLASSDGWSVTYGDWQNDAGGNRPRRIDMLRHTSQAGDIALRLVIDEWSPGTAHAAAAVAPVNVPAVAPAVTPAVTSPVAPAVATPGAAAEAPSPAP